MTSGSLNCSQGNAMPKINRRSFLKSTAGMVALATLDLTNLNCASSNQPRVARTPVKGPNERINVAILGLGGRGLAHIGNLGAKGNCRIVYLCDPDSAR